MDNKIIFLSGANITTGGPLEIYRDVLKTLSYKYSTANIFAIINDKQLFVDYSNVTYIEIKNYKRFILLKFYYEYCRYYFISKKIKIDLWLSLNDCTPTVKAKKRVVYCHNATPFYHKTIKDFLNPTIAFLQSFYYIVFYKINLKKNNFIIVQQKWIRQFFEKEMHIPKQKIIVSHLNSSNISIVASNRKINQCYTFIYPTKAQPYKNVEVLLKAVETLNNLDIKNFKVLITIKGDENRYARKIYQKYNSLNNVEWIGFVAKKELENLYNSSDCLIFCSRLETWGLPLSEFKFYNKPILVVNLPYAKETIGNYSAVNFFKMNDHNQLSDLMINSIRNTIKYDGNKETINEHPFVIGWEELFNTILE